jgi:FtsX extracellular domain
MSQATPIKKGADRARARLAEQREALQKRNIFNRFAKDTRAAYAQVAAQYVQSHKMPAKKTSVLFQFFRALLLLGSRDYWQVRLHEHLYAARLGLRQLWIAPLANFITMVVLGLVLGLPGFLGSILWHVQNPFLDLRDAASLTLYLSPEANTQQADKIKQTLSQHPKIREVKWIDKKTAWEEFKKKSQMAHYEGMVKENPLPDTAVVILQENTTKEEMDALDRQLKSTSFIDLVQWETDWILKLNSVVSFAETLLCNSGIGGVTYSEMECVTKSTRDSFGAFSGSCQSIYSFTLFIFCWFFRVGCGHF